MPDRVLIDRSGPKFRISKSGKDVSSTVPDDFVFREDDVSFKPLVSGSHTFSGRGHQDFTIPDVGYEPFVILKSSDNELPNFNSSGSYSATLSNDRKTLTLWNGIPSDSGAVTRPARTLYFWVLQT